MEIIKIKADNMPEEIKSIQLNSGLIMKPDGKYISISDRFDVHKLTIEKGELSEFIEALKMIGKDEY